MVLVSHVCAVPHSATYRRSCVSAIGDKNIIRRVRVRGHWNTPTIRGFEKGLAGGGWRLTNPQKQPKKFSRNVFLFSLGGTGKRVQKRGVNFWQRMDVLAPTPSVRQPCFETSDNSILTQMTADEFNFFWSEIENYKAEADADLIPIPGQLELHGRCRCGVLLSTCFCALYLLQI